jgi:hypothetical protein
MSKTQQATSSWTLLVSKRNLNNKLMLPTLRSPYRATSLASLNPSMVQAAILTACVVQSSHATPQFRSFPNVQINTLGHVKLSKSKCLNN